MAFIKRIFLFFILNILVVTTLSIVLSIFNVQPYISQYGISYYDLAVFCFVWGMGGALISLALSRIMAKWMMGVRLIDKKTEDPKLKNLFQTVKGLSQKAKLFDMPQVGIYSSSEVNAFATGPTKSRSLVAVSTGLLETMDQTQLEGVLAHELSHISNGDMVTMTLLQGVTNAFVMFLSRILALVLSGFNRQDRKGSYGAFHGFSLLFQTLFMILGSLLICWYSRRREFLADAGGAKIAGKEKMISALQGLRQYISRDELHTSRSEALQAFKISHPTRSGLLYLFSTHPPLDERITQLKKSPLAK